MKKVLIAVLFFISNANAQTLLVPVGSRTGTDSGIFSVASGNTFSLRIMPDKSAYCRYRGPTPGTDWDLSATLVCNTGTCPTGRLVGDSEAGIDNGFGADDAIAFIADTNTLAGSNFYDITVSSITPNPANIIIECFETTLYGNFNTVTVANPFNFLELSNDSRIDINTRISIIKNDGTLLSKTTVQVPAGQQKDISIHDIAGASNTFGRIMVAHDGGLHGLRASLTKYTSSFIITASKDFSTRENEQ